MTSRSESIAVARGQQDDGGWRGRLRSLIVFVFGNPLAFTGTAILLAWTVIMILGPLLMPYDPIAQDVVNRLQPPTETTSLVRTNWAVTCLAG